MNRRLTILIVVFSLMLAGAPLHHVLPELVTTQWSAQAKKKKGNKSKQSKKGKKGKKHRRNRSSKKRKHSTTSSSKHQRNRTSTPKVSALASVPSITTATSGRVAQSAANEWLRVGIPSGVANTVVNYKAMTINFNHQWRIPNCVAYELTATMVSMADAPGHEVRKHYNYAQDPAVPHCPQGGDYRGSGYTRGHMAPAMDMRWDKTTMAQCFMMTNMCPQEQKLNNDDWRRLEERVHRWAKRDGRLLVFTGPIMGRHPKTIGREGIAVPEAFFKVLYAPAQHRSIAFIYPNRPCPGSYRNYATTVAEVERQTGLTFASVIPHQQCKPSDWE